MPLEET